jgi:structural maintenance of chromosomes flexible hinge domain-containing protein 1
VDHVQVYKERIHKRLLGDAAAAGSQGIMHKWIQAEVAGDSATGGSDSFTRVTVSNLKAEISKQFTQEEGHNICRQLAHMYHYYLHGAEGNTRASGVLLCYVLHCHLLFNHSLL